MITARWGVIRKKGEEWKGRVIGRETEKDEKAEKWRGRQGLSHLPCQVSASVTKSKWYVWNEGRERIEGRMRGKERKKVVSSLLLLRSRVERYVRTFFPPSSPLWSAFLSLSNGLPFLFLLHSSVLCVVRVKLYKWTLRFEGSSWGDSVEKSEKGKRARRKESEEGKRARRKEGRCARWLLDGGRIRIRSWNNRSDLQP